MMKKSVDIKETEQLCYQYLSALERGDLDTLLSLFSENALVYSPIFGNCSVESFYSYIFQSISDRAMKLNNILSGVLKTNQVALHLSYTRSVEGRGPATIDVVDLFDLTEDFSTFMAVTIIYDTAPIHGDFTSCKNAPQ
ncbi:nuclear transport factor 2 family protein [Microbulbifer variabilis]|uniref:Nuclear transport factor 2 family protein n=1 Tax=Microbulbifer variabilis TaxID=266805 RepID=A0ABY4V7P3_9GAMM|nr:nuclear transport factor 2 family protein [Microbulbifer variabilis]USD20279.1 nuclear transport factor 2 family protein [Microbulbifer variabilis]